MTTRGEMIINLTDALNAEREKTKQLREALEEMVNPPTIMEQDHPFQIASWFVEKAKQALAATAPDPTE